MPAHSESSTSIPSQIALLRNDLDLPEAQEPETRLRILTILGMLEVNYDSAMARQTWAEVESLANRQHHYLLASRAIGEQGFAAFLLGDIATAKKDVVKAWTVAKVADPAAHIRYASMYGAGLVEMHKYQEALGPLDEAIKVAGKTRGAAYPTIAVNAKIEALSGLGRNQEALALAARRCARSPPTILRGISISSTRPEQACTNEWANGSQAVADLEQAVRVCEAALVLAWADAGGRHTCRGLHPSRRFASQLYAAINEAIEANENIPDELYFVPRNLGIKAEIMSRMGDVKASNDLYEKSADLFDAL